MYKRLGSYDLKTNSMPMEGRHEKSSGHWGRLKDVNYRAWVSSMSRYGKYVFQIPEAGGRRTRTNLVGTRGHGTLAFVIGALRDPTSRPPKSEWYHWDRTMFLLRIDYRGRLPVLHRCPSTRSREREKLQNVRRRMDAGRSGQGASKVYMS
jgi:hypothetical protein